MASALSPAPSDGVGQMGRVHIRNPAHECGVAINNTHLQPRRRHCPFGEAKVGKAQNAPLALLQFTSDEMGWCRCS